jgi:hypothetical protein
LYDYKKEISRILRNLRILDDEKLTQIEDMSSRIKAGQMIQGDSKKTNQYQCPFDDDWQLINQCLDEGVYPAEEKLAINGLLPVYIYHAEEFIFENRLRSIKRSNDRVRAIQQTVQSQICDRYRQCDRCRLVDRARRSEDQPQVQQSKRRTTARKT